MCLTLAGCRQGGWTAMTRPFNEAVARRHAQQAERLSDRGDEAGAAEAYEAALDHDPQNAVLHAEAAAVYARRGQVDFAVGHYQAAVRADSNNAEYALALAETLMRHAENSVDRRELLKAAERAYAHARWLAPERLDAALGSARCLRQLGRMTEAAQVLREAERLDPSSPAVHIELASIEEEMGNADAALGEYGQALKLDPDNVTAHNACGLLNLEMSRRMGSQRPLARERAVAHFRKSLEVDPNQPRICEHLSQLESTFAEATTTD
jgi:tetratricopeptide (TPR) repeat protein